MEKAEKAIEEVFKGALELGGTMSGEHDVGIAKAPYIPLEITPQTAAYMKAVKRALDPTTEPTNMDQLVRSTGLPAQRVLATICVLEIRHLIRRIGGNCLVRL